MIEMITVVNGWTAMIEAFVLLFVKMNRSSGVLILFSRLPYCAKVFWKETRNDPYRWRLRHHQGLIQSIPISRGVARSLTIATFIIEYDIPTFPPYTVKQ